MIDRRQFCSGLLLGGLCGFLPAGVMGQSTYRITDLAGRQVELLGVPKRIVLLEARDILSMALFHPDPAQLLVGWAAIDRLDSPDLIARFDGRRTITEVGKQTPASISTEGIISIAPDLLVASDYMLPAGDARTAFFELMRSAGIPVLLSDVSSNDAGAHTTPPLVNSSRHLQLWGEIFRQGERSLAYSAFVEQRVAVIAQRLENQAPVTTYLEVQSTLDDCCWAAGTQVWGQLLSLAGGQPLPAVQAPWFQRLQLEYLLSTPFAVYIASGGGWESGGRPAIGPGIEPARGREGLQGLLGRTGFAGLPSSRERRVHGIWTGLISMPLLNLLFIEVVAKWLHPAPFDDLDPAETLRTINRRFLLVPLDGPLWVSLEDAVND
ncbi:iron complex transport system substrate-binding protein [Pseudomonas flavescens]|uniref:Iron complex transport system substrate-binding protein n=1 Tax=Phytopseudomonas flavescens TaxID=29435 RepID=A0A1G8P5W8_9GAMM|nr:iron complex transport system substrate-binding protein [Pseudomonas flavescens]